MAETEEGRDPGEGVATLSFEAALEELERIVTQLERGDVPLEQSIEIYERGETLKKRCEALLRNAEMRVEKVRLRADGTPAGVEPLDPTDPPAETTSRKRQAARRQEPDEDIPF